MGFCGCNMMQDASAETENEKASYVATSPSRLWTFRFLQRGYDQLVHVSCRECSNDWQWHVATGQESEIYRTIYGKTLQRDKICRKICRKDQKGISGYFNIKILWEILRFHPGCGPSEAARAFYSWPSWPRWGGLHAAMSASKPWSTSAKHWQSIWIHFLTCIL